MHDLHPWSTPHAGTAPPQGPLSAVQWCGHADKSIYQYTTIRYRPTKGTVVTTVQSLINYSGRLQYINVSTRSL